MLASNNKKTWHDIWENKNKDSKTALHNKKTSEVVEYLLKCNGFDSKTGSFCLQDYKDFICDIFQKASLSACESIYEVGCGAGAFLYAMNLQKITSMQNEALECESRGGGGGKSYARFY